MNTENYAITYPELTIEGQEKTQAIIDKFGKQLQELMNETVVDFTRNLAVTITDDDSWIDVRSKTLNALCGYSEDERILKAAGKYAGQWWVRIRAKILEENREAIINDIIADKEYEIKQLKERVEMLRQDLNCR